MRVPSVVILSSLLRSTRGFSSPCRSSSCSGVGVVSFSSRAAARGVRCARHGATARGAASGLGRRSIAAPAEAQDGFGSGMGKHMGKRRRKQKNKYAEFSKADALDPVSQRLADIREEEERENTERETERDAIRAELRKRGAIAYPDETTIDPYDPATFGFLEVGTISGAHGVNGEVKVRTVTDFGAERLCQEGVKHMRAPDRRFPRPVELVSGRQQQEDVFIVRIRGVTDREQAANLRDYTLYAWETDRPELDTDEYMVGDLVGLSAYDFADPNRLIGKVSSVVIRSDLSQSALGQDLLELDLPMEEGGVVKSCYIPFVPDMVPEIDIPAKLMLLDLPDGMLDLAFVKTVKFRIRGFLPGRVVGDE